MPLASTRSLWATAGKAIKKPERMRPLAAVRSMVFMAKRSLGACPKERAEPIPVPLPRAGTSLRGRGNIIPQGGGFAHRLGDAGFDHVADGDHAAKPHVAVQ